MANGADPDQLASSEANWSGSTLFAKAEYIRVQQNKGCCFQLKSFNNFLFLHENILCGDLLRHY